MTTDEEKLVMDNIGIAYTISWKYYKKFNQLYELEDLQSVAFLGLTKAAKTFNKNLGFVFSTYAYNCIQNELRQYYRDNRKHNDLLYLSDTIENTITLEDMLADTCNILDEIDKNEYIKKLYIEINNLEGRYKIILQYRLKGKTMVDIAQMLGLSQSQISKDYNKALNILRNKFKDWRDI